MNQLLQEQIAPPLKKSVKVKQIAAAIFLIIGLIIPSIYRFFQTFSIYHDNILAIINISNISSSLLCTIGFIILSTISQNRPTKLMMYIIIGIELLLSPLLNILLNIILDTSFPLLIYGYIYYVIGFSCICIDLYAYSIIIENNSISQNAIKWINIICISLIIKLCHTPFFVINWLRESFDRENWCTVFNIDYGFSYIWLILMIVAYVKFCRCKAFDGNPDTNGSATVSYSPLNKYTASMFITTAVIIGTLIAYYKFIAPELMNLNI